MRDYLVYKPKELNTTRKRFRVCNYYALYKGEDPLCTGTKQELADYLGVSIETISFYASPTYKKRNPKGNNYLVFRIRDDEDEGTD